MTDTDEPKKQFTIQKLYVKDLSFESPTVPGSFTFEQWDPAVELNLNNSIRQVADGVFEVELRLTATVANQDSTAYLIEVQQAGLFGIGGFDDGERDYLLGSQCMSILFPYAREVVSDLSVRGGFPPLVLSPVNFDALYQQHRQNQAQQKGAGDAEPGVAEAGDAETGDPRTGATEAADTGVGD